MASHCAHSVINHYHTYMSFCDCALLVQHEALEAAFSAFPTPVRYMLQHTADGVTLQSSVFIRTPDLPPTLGAGRVVLMGEAAPPLRPTGQEESQALEDAAELGACVMLFGVTKVSSC